jgi:hypothetical protein
MRRRSSGERWGATLPCEPLGAVTSDPAGYEAEPHVEVFTEGGVVDIGSPFTSRSPAKATMPYVPRCGVVSRSPNVNHDGVRAAYFSCRDKRGIVLVTSRADGALPR